MRYLLTKKERLKTLGVAVVVTGVVLIPQLHLYFIDIVGTIVFLVLSGGEAADGLPMWLAAFFAAVLNVSALYCLFLMIVKFKKGRRTQWER